MKSGLNNQLKTQNLHLFNRVLLVVSLIGIAFFCSVFIFFSTDAKSLYDTKRLFVVAVIGLSAFACLVSQSYRNNLIDQFSYFSKPVKYLLVTLCLSAIYANVTGWYFWRAQADFFYFIGLAILTLNLALVIPQRRKMVFEFYSLFVFFAFLCVAVGHLVTVFISHSTPSVFSLFNFTNPRLLNQLMIWTMLPTLYMAVLSHRSKKRNWLAMIPLTLNFAIMFATDARGFAVGTGGAIVLWLILDPILRRTIVIKTGQALLLGYGIKMMVLHPLPAYFFLGNPSELLELRTDSSGRLELWREALSMLSFFGHGGDTLACNLTDFARPHNSIILVAVNWGVIAALSYISLLACAIRYLFITANRKVMVAGITVLSGFAYSFVSGVLDSPLSQLASVLAIALFWGLIYRHRVTVSQLDVHVATNKILPHLLLVICAFLYLGLVGHKVYLRLANDSYRHIENVRFTPQFWLGQNCYGVAPMVKLDPVK